MNRAALALALFCAGCALQSGSSPRDIQALQDVQLRQALEMMQVHSQGQQDLMAGRDTEAARAYKKHSEAMSLQARQLDAQMRKDPDYVRAREQDEREDREVLRKNPSMIESEFSLSDIEEAELGFGMAQQFLGNQRLVADEALQRYVNTVGAWVAQQCERPGLPWRFAVIDDDATNAFAVPGGYVFITRGMLALAETESELAGILGHEISHVVRKHHLRWIYLNKELEVSVRRAGEQIGESSTASRTVFQEIGKEIQRTVDQMNSPEMRAGLSKSEEFEADIDGAILAWRAGYEAWGLVAVMQRFEAASREQYAASALSGHLEPLQRLMLLDLALRSREEKNTLGEPAVGRFQRATAHIRRQSG